jgi:hypothetical protein
MDLGYARVPAVENDALVGHFTWAQWIHDLAGLPRILDLREVIKQRGKARARRKGQGNESRLTRPWPERPENFQQVLWVPGGALAAALDRPVIGDLADEVEGEVAHHRHVLGTMTDPQA